jgi:hypothetical protein
MSTNPVSLSEWLKEKHKSEFDLAEEIRQRAERIYNEIPKNLLIYDTVVNFGVSRETPQSKVRLSFEESTLVFMGILSRAILDGLIDHFAGLVEHGKADKVIKQKIYEVFYSMVKYATAEEPPGEPKWVSCMACKQMTSAIGKYCMHCKAEIR